MSKGTNRKLIKGKMQMANNYIKESLNLLVVREKQIKTQNIILLPLD